MRAFVVTYDGSYLGGVAVVIAESEEKAMDLVREHGKTENFKDARVEDSFSLDTPVVLHNDNGDY